MASVYRARLLGPQGFDKEVAVKVLLTQEHAGWQSDLAAEARVSARLRHRNIVDVYEFAEVDGTVLIAMELVDGLSLAKALSLGALPPPSLVAEIGMQACAGLGAAHAACDNGLPLAVVHRDIKPSNLMLSVDGNVKVVDFGIATMGGVTAELGQDDVITGTLPYMSPEQFCRGAVDFRSDIFSLGLVLYAMVGGKALFSSKRNAHSLGNTLDAFIRERLDQLDVENRVPGIIPILRRTLSSVPEQRYASAEALEDDLDELVHELPRGPRLRRWVRDLVRTQNDDDVGTYQPDLPTSDIHNLLSAPTVPEVRPIAAVSGPPNLPQEGTEFIGNQFLVDGFLASLHEGPGCWFLYGPQGVGKTRTVLHILHRLAREGWSDLVWVSAEHSETIDDMVALTGSRLGVDLSQCTTAAERIEAIGRALSGFERVVVVVDDITRIADEVVSILSGWAARSGGARVVATCVHRVESDVPELIQVTPLAEEDAIALLECHCESPGSHDPLLLRRVVNAVDRLPLAIELAAARINVVGAHDVAADVATVTSQDGQALHDMLAWSWSKLEAWEQKALIQCAVFLAPFSLMAAESVVQLPPGAPWVHDVLQQLHRASWVSVEKTRYGERFRVFASVRTFVNAQEDKALNTDALFLRHALWMAERADPEMLQRVAARTGQNRTEQIRGMGPDFRQAIDYAIQRGESSLAAQIVGPVAELLGEVGSLKTAIPLFESMLDMPNLHPEDRGLVLALFGDLKLKTGDKEGGLAGYREALEILDPINAELAAVRRLDFAFALGMAGEFEEAEAQGSKVLRALKVNHWTYLEARTYEFMARLYQFTKRPEESLRSARAAKRAWAPNSNVSEAQIDYCLGEAECNAMNFDVGYRWLCNARDGATHSGSASTGYALALLLPMCELGRYSELTEIMEWAAVRADRLGHIVYQLYAKIYLACIRVIRTGDFQQGAALFESAAQSAAELNVGYMTRIINRTSYDAKVTVALTNGDLEMAGELMGSTPIPPEGSYAIVREAHLLCRIHYCILRGDLDQAEAYADSVRNRLTAGAEYICTVRLDLMDAWISASRGKTWAAQRLFDSAQRNPVYKIGGWFYLDRLFEVVEKVVKQP